jgi:hypothetical protein
MLTLDPNGKHIKHSKQLSKVVITVATQASVPQPSAAISIKTQGLFKHSQSPSGLNTRENKLRSEQITGAGLGSIKSHGSYIKQHGICCGQLHQAARYLLRTA